MEEISLDPELLRRYDRPGPRYTSYPTAPHFTDTFGEDAFRRYALGSNDEPIPRQLSVYLHIPYCFSPCFYCGCNRIITRDPGRGRVYVERLVREVETVARLFDRDRDVIQLHLGGGTPNFLNPTDLGELISSLGRHFHFSTSGTRDFSIELDPRAVRAGDLAAYAALGFNRVSLGIQDFDQEVQRAVNREQSVEQTMQVIADFRDSGMRSVNVDLMYGLPRQTVTGFGRTLDMVLEAQPDRLAVYGYAHLPEMFKAQRHIKTEELPDAETRLTLLCVAIERLSAAGYRYIGMDHFALPLDDLARARETGHLHRNFMGYTTHPHTDLIGLGVSAISHVGDSYSQSPRNLPAWETAVDHGRLPVWRGMELDSDDVLRADAIQKLMCQGEIDVTDFEYRHRIDFQSYFASSMARLQPLVENGLVRIERNVIAATSRGRLLLRIIAMCFDRYLTTSPTGGRTRFSRVI
jgi:oxygen-independent coproporphyrinogen III oxidase